MKVIGHYDPGEQLYIGALLRTRDDCTYAIAHRLVEPRLVADGSRRQVKTDARQIGSRLSRHAQRCVSLRGDPMAVQVKITNSNVVRPGPPALPAARPPMRLHRPAGQARRQK